MAGQKTEALVASDARRSRRFNAFLRAEAERLGGPCLGAAPGQTADALCERALRLLGGRSGSA